ncbi:nicotinate-nucleotide adenylyltransferase [Numidum massiliense]|uniref:nicotinate-nucleotide adenylyltransferase n=1 Tax=Numidum massiliense TaxID=1522315 RepID=UPI0006D57B38|nr:nicotinate-nucleotide adenylyltransferase [Numidum massiliense]
MRVGLMGGTFDPIHLGHLIAADHVQEQLDLDEVWFLLAAVPPHKSGQRITAPEHRLQMVRLAVSDHPHFRVCTIEFERRGRSYTVDTLTILRQRYPEHDFFFMIGGDMVQNLPNWHRVDDLVHLVEFVGMTRPGYARQPLPPPIAAAVQYAELRLVDISATDIRERVKEGRSIRYIVPDQVRNYIEEQQLYAT